MSAKIMFADLLWIALVLIATLQLPKIWRGRSSVLDTVPGWWPWGNALWFGTRRMIPLSVALGWVVLGILWFPSAGRSPDALTDQEFGIALVLLGVLLAIGGLMASVVFFNCPAFFVPPKWRSEAGAVEYWFGRWRRRRPGR